jgi:hypothetical protein
MSPEKNSPPEMYVTGFPFPPREIDDSDLPPLPPEMLAPREPTEEEIEVGRDMDWAENDPEIKRLYEGKIIAVRNHLVIAVGDDWKTVIEEAERVSGLPGNLVAIVSIPDTASFFGCH